MSPSINIFHFLLDNRVGGPHIFARTIADALATAATSTMITAGDSSFADIRLVNLRRIWRPLYILEMAINILLVMVICMTRRTGNRPAVFDVHGAANLAPLVAARIAGIPVVWHFHETEPRFRALVRVGRRFLAPGRFKMVAVAKPVARFYNLDGCTVVSPPIDTAFWRHASITAKRKEETFRMITIGNIAPVKGHRYLFDALEALGDEDWHVTIVGAPLSSHREYHAGLRNRAAGLMKQFGSCTVEFAGWWDRSQLLAALPEYDVFVLPSVSEGCPIGLLEAMAMRKICVAADVGGVADMMTDGVSGFIFPARDSAALAEILRMVRGLPPDTRAGIGRRARESVKKRCSIDSAARSHLGLYRQLLSGAARHKQTRPDACMRGV